jgi:hypothetical protein
MADSCWFETIPVEEFTDDTKLLMAQLSATKWGKKTEFYRKNCSPLDVNHLMRFLRDKKNIIWWNEECFLMIRRLPTTVKSKFRKGTSNIQFFNESKVFIYGMTKQSVAQAIEQMLYLKDELSGVVHIGRYGYKEARFVVPTTFITTQFFAEYMKVNPKRRLCFSSGCKLSIEESIALASHPEPIKVWNVRLPTRGVLLSKR